MHHERSEADRRRPPVVIDDDLEVLSDVIDEVTKLGHRDEVDDEQVYDVSIRWGTALAGRLQRLVHYSTAGRLDDADEGRYEALCGELRGMSDVIDRFKLAQPRFTETPPASAKRHRGPKPAT